MIVLTCVMSSTFRLALRICRFSVSVFHISNATKPAVGTPIATAMIMYVYGGNSVPNACIQSGAEQRIIQHVILVACYGREDNMLQEIRG